MRVVPVSLLTVACLGGLAACKERVETAAARPPPVESEPALPPLHRDEPCPSAARLLPGGGECRCVAPVSTTDTVWGTGQYTDDSSICTAALHAGVIDERGGHVRIESVAACKAYAGTTRNGVTTRRYGPWRRSFAFPGTAVPVCDQTLRPSAEIAVAPAVDAGVALPSCPAVLPLVADGSPMQVRCRCAPPVPAGPFWGTGPYTLDSSPCAAAAHAGAIAASGGDVVLTIVEGCARYAAGTAHGVSGHAAGRTAHAFVIDGGATTCPPSE